MANAQTRGWGGPGCTREQLVRLDVPGIPLNVRREVAPLFAELIRWLTEQRAAHGAPPLSSSGGYVKRYISGTRVWSNHSWGLAADFNAATNPYSVRGGTDMPPGTSAKAASLGMRWGGDYKVKKDAMHFEFVGTPADAARLVAQLGAQPAPAPAPVPAPKPAPVVVPRFPLAAGQYFGPWDGPRESVSGFQVRRGRIVGRPGHPGLLAWQRRMQQRGWKLTADGLWGDESARVLVAFQREKGLAPDGKLGPRSWAAAWTAPVR